MKRFLLLITTVLALAGWASAAEVTFDFNANDYGLPAPKGTTPQYVKSGTLTEYPATLEISVKSGNGFAKYTDGLRVYRVSSKEAGDATLTASVADAKITKIEMTVAKTFTNVYIDGTSTTASNNVYTWTGDAESVAINIQTKVNAAIKTIKITYAPNVTLTPVTLAFAQSEVEVVKDDIVELPALSGVPEGVTVNYTSSDKTIADVEGGYIYGYAVGTATITATTAPTETYQAGEATLTVNVVEKADTRLEAGLSFSEESVTAYVDQEDFKAPTLTKKTTAAVVYTSSNHDVAVVDEATGEVIIGAAGTSVITATAAENTEYKAGTASYTIVVSKIASQLAFAETAVEKYLGSSEYGEFPVLTNPENIAVSYTSSNTDVATVAADGVITIVAAGTTTITAAPADAAKYEGTAAYTLTVTDASIGAGSYVLLNDASLLVDGAKVIIVSTANNLAMGAQKPNNFAGSDVTIVDNSISNIENLSVLEIVNGTDGIAFKFGEQYLGPASANTKSNYLKTYTDPNYASVTIDANSNATIKFSLNNDGRNTIFCNLNNGNPIFACYKTTDQQAVQLYIEKAGQGVVAPEVTPSFEELTEGKYMASFEVEEGVSVYYSIVSESLPRVAGKDGLEYTKYTEPFEVEDNQTLNYYSELKGVQSETKSMLINKQTTGVENILVDQESAAEYYDLQGRRVVNPANGIFIRRQGSTVTKVAL